MGGILVKAGVTKQTARLVAGDQDLTVLAGHVRGSKHQIAEDMQAVGHLIPIIGENNFGKLVVGCGTA